jgi:hypothetical protein
MMNFLRSANTARLRNTGSNDEGLILTKPFKLGYVTFHLIPIMTITKEADHERPLSTEP